MSILLSLSKHKEFESNSTLQIIIRKKEGAEAEKVEAEKVEAENFALVRNFLHAPLFMLL